MTAVRPGPEEDPEITLDSTVAWGQADAAGSEALEDALQQANTPEPEEEESEVWPRAASSYRSMTPQRFADRYEVGPLLGAGSMAEVYQGYDPPLVRPVAIKLLRSQYADGPAFLTRFRREAQVVGEVSHPNIIAVYDSGTEGSTPFIVMEYVQGRTLKDVIHENPLRLDRAAEVCADVASALSAVHVRGIVHRDIKPGNVMLSAEGKVKVVDFGIARAAAVPPSTETIAVLGTPQYIAPEQATGLGVDARSDLYSLGCCLYELLTGQAPFRGLTAVAIAYRHVHEEPIPPRALNPAIPPGLEAVCLKAMAKAPEARYQEAWEFLQDLDHARSGQNLLATVTPGRRLRRQQSSRWNWWPLRRDRG